MGEIITFYSYKGGTGRTMALANTACFLAKNYKVLIIDWDLEAPGLAKYFEPYINQTVLVENQDVGQSSSASTEENILSINKGLLDFFEEANNSLPDMPRKAEDEALLNDVFEKLDNYLLPLNISFVEGSLSLLPAGNYETDENIYTNRLSQFDWVGFYDKIPAFFSFFGTFLRKKYDYILIDSRTGHTDISGICTMLLPDKLVLVFTPNKQSIDGVIRVARKVAAFRISSPFYNTPLLMYPLPSRIDEALTEEQERWKKEYRNKFEILFKDIYDLPNTITLKRYFNNVQIRHSAKYAYGEKLAALIGNEYDPESTYNSFLRFTNQLTAGGSIWEDEPFSKLIEPISLFVIYAQDDRDSFEPSLSFYLAPLIRSQNITWKENDNPPIENWSDETIRFLNNNTDAIIIFVSPKLLNVFLTEETLKTEVAKLLSIDYIKIEIENEKHEPINLDVTSNIRPKLIFPILLENCEWRETFLNQQPIYPARNTPLIENDDIDEWWYNTIKAFNQELIIFASSLNPLSS